MGNAKAGRVGFLISDIKFMRVLQYFERMRSIFWALEDEDIEGNWEMQRQGTGGFSGIFIFHILFGNSN